MENNSIFHPQYEQQSIGEGFSIESKQNASSAPTNESGLTGGKTIKRENDSMDDFEHLEHEISPNDESRADIKNVLDVTSMQLIDFPHASKSEKIISEGCATEELTTLASKLERNILDTSIPADERILQPVPATPPPSANYEKYEEPERRESYEDEEDTTSQVLVGSAQTFSGIVGQDRDPKDQHYPHDYNNQLTSNTIERDNGTIGAMDSKAATMAFMETEKASNDYHQSEPLSIDTKMEHEAKSLIGLENRDERVFGDDKSQVGEFRDHFRAESEETASDLTARLSPAKFENKCAMDSGIEDASVNTTKDRSVSPKKRNFNEEIDDDSEHDDKHDEAALSSQKNNDFLSNIESSVLPVPEKSPEYDFLAGETSPNVEIKKSTNEPKSLIEDDTWNVVERPETKNSASFVNKEIDTGEDTFKAQRDYYNEAPTKPLPPLPRNDNDDEDNEHFAIRNEYERERLHDETFEMSNDFVSSAPGKSKGQQHSGAETGDSEFESAPEQSPAKTSARSTANETSTHYTGRKVNADDIAPKPIFTDMGLVAALIYWRQPEKTGVVFGAVLGVLLSLAYFSLISVFAYLSLLTLCGTVGFRVYKTFMQAVQKTSDGHPFKDILEVDLTLPAEKVHEVADVAVAHANAAVAELRRLFLVEDFIDSLKFGVVLWTFTYLGSWFNGMTLIIIGVVALFTLPKVYETNKAQIDQNFALVHGKINELTAKVKAAIPLGKKSEPTKEE
ncbi:reticulon-4-like isoform X2 [Venturia canescens]|uniref:reticulon-4-like isoform X2 n=1 Tax=Venturia canescens TaxID=32260 RepID=UPI001C9C82BF|nr:reticulon-4-like isoform X2 [Venturia canescens]